MKVLHINVNYLTSALHQTMIKYLDEIGIENKVFAPTYNKKNAIINPSNNVTVSECFNKWDRLWFYHKQSKIIESVKSNFDVKTFELIHAYTLFTDGNVAMQLSKQYGIPYVVAVRNTDLNDFFKYMLHLRRRGIDILRNATQIFFLSKAYMERLLDRYVPGELQNEIREKSRIIPNGIDQYWHVNKSFKTTENYELLLKDKVLKVIYAGVIDKNKNIQLTVKALKRLKNEGWSAELTIAGKIINKKVFSDIMKSGIVHYVGQQDRDGLLSLYRESNLFIMPSHKETFGLVYVEAMSQGLPVIYSRGQGFDKQFDEGVVGYSVDSQDSKELFEKIKMVISNYLDISKNSIKSIDKFNWTIIAQEYKSIYEIVMSKNDFNIRPS